MASARVGEGAHPVFMIGRLPVAVVLGAGIAVLTAISVATALPPESSIAARIEGSGEGDAAWARIFVASQFAAFALYAAALVLVRRAAIAVRVVLVVTAIVQLLPLAAPLMLSRDAWGYWATARIGAINGGNPYIDHQSTFPNDFAFQFTSPVWRDQISVYGPAFTGPSELAALVVGEQAALAALVFKVAAAVSVVAIAVLVARLSPKAAFAAAFVGWNPVFAMQFGGAGHNEAIMTALVVLGLWLASRGKPGAAGAAWATGLFARWNAIVVLPLQVLEDRAHGRRSILPGLLVVGLVLAALATVRYGPVWVDHVFLTLGNATSRFSLSVWSRLGEWLPDPVVTLVPLAIFGVAYLWLLRTAWRGRARRGLAMGLLLATSPFLWPWYVITPAALSAADDDDLALWLAFGLCAYTGLLYAGRAASILRLSDLLS